MSGPPSPRPCPSRRPCRAPGARSGVDLIEIHVVDVAGAGGGLGGGLAPGFDAGSEQGLVGSQADAEVVLLAGEPQHVVRGFDQGAVGSVVDLRSVVPLQFVAGDAEDGGDAVEGEAVEHGQDDDAAGFVTGGVRGASAACNDGEGGWGSSGHGYLRKPVGVVGQA